LRASPTTPKSFCLQTGTCTDRRAARDRPRRLASATQGARSDGPQCVCEASEQRGPRRPYDLVTCPSSQVASGPATRRSGPWSQSPLAIHAGLRSPRPWRRGPRDSSEGLLASRVAGHRPAHGGSDFHRRRPGLPDDRFLGDRKIDEQRGQHCPRRQEKRKPFMGRVLAGVSSQALAASGQGIQPDVVHVNTAAGRPVEEKPNHVKLLKVRVGMPGRARRPASFPPRP